MWFIVAFCERKPNYVNWPAVPFLRKEADSRPPGPPAQDGLGFLRNEANFRELAA
jgi:hypothetical protein